MSAGHFPPPLQLRSETSVGQHSWREITGIIDVNYDLVGWALTTKCQGCESLPEGAQMVDSSNCVTRELGSTGDNTQAFLVLVQLCVVDAKVKRDSVVARRWAGSRNWCLSLSFSIHCIQFWSKTKGAACQPFSMVKTDVRQNKGLSRLKVGLQAVSRAKGLVAVIEEDRQSIFSAANAGRLSQGRRSPRPGKWFTDADPRYAPKGKYEYFGRFSFSAGVQRRGRIGRDQKNTTSRCMTNWLRPRLSFGNSVAAGYGRYWPVW